MRDCKNRHTASFATSLRFRQYHFRAHQKLTAAVGPTLSLSLSHDNAPVSYYFFGTRGKIAKEKVATVAVRDCSQQTKPLTQKQSRKET